MWWLGYDFTILKQVETRVLYVHTYQEVYTCGIIRQTMYDVLFTFFALQLLYKKQQRGNADKRFTSKVFIE